MSKFRAWFIHRAVTAGAGAAASPGHRKLIYTAGRSPEAAPPADAKKNIGDGADYATVRTDTWSIVLRIIGSIIAVIVLWLVLKSLLPPLKDLVWLFGPLNAYAKDANGAISGLSAVDLKQVLNALVMVCIVVSFFWTLKISLRRPSSDEDTSVIQKATEINRMLLGFLIATGKNYLIG